MSATKMRKTLLSTRGGYTKTSQKRSRKRKSSAMESKRVAMDIAQADNLVMAPTPWIDAAFSSYIPKSTKANLRYAASFTQSCGVASFGAHVFGANNAFDPDYTGAGHQPNGFDQLMTMYEHYQVIGSKITVFGETGGEFCMYVSLKNNAGTSTSIINCLENRPQFTTIAHSEDNFCQISQSFSQKEFFGQGQLDPDFQGTVSAGPGQTAFFHVGIAANNPTSTLTLYGFVIIDMICVFTEPAQPPQS